MQTKVDVSFEGSSHTTDTVQWFPWFILFTGQSQATVLRSGMSTHSRRDGFDVWRNAMVLRRLSQSQHGS